MKKTLIPCALIGTGRIGSSLELDRRREKPASHAGAIARHPQTWLAGGCDTDPLNLARFAGQWRLPPDRLFDSAEEMLKKTKPQILHIATHPDSHLSLLQLAMERDIPVVVLEKPVCSDPQEARDLLSQLSRSRTRVVMNHERRFSSDYRYVKQRIDGRVYGPLLSIQGHLYMGKTKEIRRVLWHDGTHMADLFRFLSGGDLVVNSVSGNFASADPNGFIHLTAGHTAGYLECSAGRDFLHFELDLFFESGRIRVGNGILEEEISVPSPYYDDFQSLMPVRTPHFRKTGYFSGMMSHAVDLVENPFLKSLSSLEDGLAALDFIQEALAEGGVSLDE